MPMGTVIGAKGRKIKCHKPPPVATFTAITTAAER
jgi:hypothetical protein